MTTLVLVRHGETVWHKENRYAGRSDIALTERGLEQAGTLSVWAEHAGLDAIVVTDLSRSQHTAAPSAAATGLEPRIEPRLREVDFGAAEGLTKAEMIERFPRKVSAFHQAPADNPLPEGERGADAIARALPAIHELTERYPDGTVLIVGHSTMNRLLLCHFLAIDPNHYRGTFPQLRNVARTTLRIRDDNAALLEFNAY